MDNEATVIVIRVDESGLDECLRLMYMVAGEEAPAGLPVGDRFDNLLRLDLFIRNRYGYVPLDHYKNRLTTYGAGITRIIPVPSNSLRNHCLALEAGTIYRDVGEVANNLGEVAHS